MVGGGAIGLIMVQLARLSGASKIILSEPNESVVARHSRWGQTLRSTPLEEGSLERFLAQTDDMGADVVIECVGNLSAVRSAFQFARRGATILLFSVPKVDATFELPLFEVFKKS